MNLEATNKKYQFIWTPDEWQGVFFVFSKGSISLIYDWFLYLGWLEIRKWRKPVTQKEIEDFYAARRSKNSLTNTF